MTGLVPCKGNNTCVSSAGQSPASSDLVLIAPIPPSESLDIHLMALTADGRRFYLSTQLVTSVAAGPGRRTPSVLRNVRSRSAIPAPQHQGQSRYINLHLNVADWACLTSCNEPACSKLLSRPMVGCYLECQMACSHQDLLPCHTSVLLIPSISSGVQGQNIDCLAGA